MYDGRALYSSAHVTPNVFLLFPRSCDVIHPQLWESGSGYETSVEPAHKIGGGGGGVVSYPDPNSHSCGWITSPLREREDVAVM